MTKTQRKGNGRKSKLRAGFAIRREPVVHLRQDPLVSDAAGRAESPHVPGQPLLFAIARDERTIFASWSIDWQSVFKGNMPADRRVHLRLINTTNLEHTSLAIEPLAAFHYMMVPSRSESYRVEIGYYEPLDTWNCIATSHHITVPPHETAVIGGVDLLTIPLHVSFDQLANLFAAPNATSIARVVSKFQKSVANSSIPQEASAAANEMLQMLDVSASEITAAERTFGNIGGEKLARRTRSVLKTIAGSPARGFERESGS